ncbi:MAG: UvrD-helicase domain-containing protein [Sedimentisphaerales bacterium]|nr:UvrD-helicase domain-containing protein [Sedimentisphaerales bacterium]
MNNSSMRQLTDSQSQAVHHKDGPLLVLAGPGSGKTRVITHRIAFLIESGVRPYNICAITFTNKAAEEMRQRAYSFGSSAGAQISTFHSLCVRILRQYSTQAGIKPGFTVYDDSDQSKCVKEAIKKCELDTSSFAPSKMLNAISTLKNKLVDPETFKAEAYDFFSNKLSKVYSHYQQLLSERNGLDFDDLLMKVAFLIRDCTEVRDELNNRYKYLLIDEYQDTNHAQYTIAKYLASSHNNICAAGDPDQSIYRWRGADIKNILAFETDYPNAMVVKLEENFRSGESILRKADNLIAYNKNRKVKVLVPTKTEPGFVDVSGYSDEAQEAQMIAEQIRNLALKGVSLKDVAIFYRVNAMSRVIEEAFVRNNINYQIVRGVEFYRRKEIRDLLAYLKVLVNPDDEVSLLRIINTPSRGIGKVTLDKVKYFASVNGISMFDALGKAGQISTISKGTQAKLAVVHNMLVQFQKDASGKAAPIAERVFKESGLEKMLQAEGIEGENSLENVSELINAASKFDQQPAATVSEHGELVETNLLDFLQQISLFSDADAYDTSTECVALMTLHAAKGLEFDNVFIIGLEEGILPHERANISGDEDELEEERRLFFVGITRAKSALYISFAKYRTIRGQTLRSIPSQFLYELDRDFEKKQKPESYSDSQLEEYSDFEDQQEESEEFKTGQLVRHGSFGLGRVKKFVDMGANSIVQVQFNTGKTKSLMLKYANLTKVDN